MFLFLTFGVFVACVYGVIKVNGGLREMKKYEFEHRTSGGVVQFSSFEESEQFEKRKQRYFALGVPMGIVALICFFILFFGVILVTVHV